MGAGTQGTELDLAPGPPRDTPRYWTCSKSRQSEVAGTDFSSRSSLHLLFPHPTPTQLRGHIRAVRGGRGPPSPRLEAWGSTGSLSASSKRTSYRPRLILHHPLPLLSAFLEAGRPTRWLQPGFSPADLSIISLLWGEIIVGKTKVSHIFHHREPRSNSLLPSERFPLRLGVGVWTKSLVAGDGQTRPREVAPVAKGQGPSPSLCGIYLEEQWAGDLGAAHVPVLSAALGPTSSNQRDSVPSPLPITPCPHPT